MAEKPDRKTSATPGRASADQKSAVAVAPANPPGPASPVTAAPAPRPAVASVPLFGGFRGGRARKDGLKPGSIEAVEADRAKDRERKRLRRQAATAAAPPALPSAVVPVKFLPSPASDSALPQAGDLAPGAAPAPGPGDLAPAPLVLWQAGDLLPVTRNAVPLFEALCQKPVLKKARRANLPKEVLAEIERDSRWPDGSKKMLADTGSALAAKYLNKSGVSAAFKDEVNFGVALCSIAAGQIALQRRLDALIAASQAPAPAVASGPAPAR